MGHDLLESNDSLFAELLAVGSDRAQLDLTSYVTGKVTEGFIRSAVLQPLITAVSLSYWNRLRQEGVVFDAVLGHSLGEITALAGCGILDPVDTVDVAAYRGIQMDLGAEACGGGGMAVVLFSEEVHVAEAISAYGLQDSLYIANYNAPNQTVISGTNESLAHFESRFSQEYRSKVQRIDVAGPWHTPFIAAGRENYLAWAVKKTFSNPNIDFIMNGTAECAGKDENFIARTADQLVKPVFWSKSLQKTAELYSESIIIEVGPGKILSGLIRANKLQKKNSAIAKVFALLRSSYFLKKASRACRVVRGWGGQPGM